MNAKTKAKISELLVIMGTILFVGGAMSYLRGELSAEQIWGIGAMALLFVGAGAGIKTIFSQKIE